MKEKKTLIGKKVIRLFLIIWPPVGEDKCNNIDNSLGLVFSDNIKNMYIISTNTDDMWTPDIQVKQIPQKIFTWLVLDKRIKDWMNGKNKNLINHEYFELTNVNLFANIVNNKILDIEYINVESIDESANNPFGIKLIFKDDYILSTPISNGNTIETSKFNKNDNLSFFRKLGNIKYKSIKKTDTTS